MAQLFAAFLFTASLFATPLWLLAQPAYACSCELVRPADAVAQSESIVIARLERIVTPVSPTSSDYTATIRVSEYIKGIGPRTVEVIETGSSCGVLYSMDTEYLLFLFRNDSGQLRPSMCLGSMPLDNVDVLFAAARIRDVRNAVAEQAPRPAPTSASDVSLEREDVAQPGWAIPLAIASGSAALFGLAFLLWRGTRRA